MSNHPKDCDLGVFCPKCRQDTAIKISKALETKEKEIQALKEGLKGWNQKKKKLEKRLDDFRERAIRLLDPNPSKVNGDWGDPFPMLEDFIRTSTKEIKTLKEQALTWGEHARKSQQAAREIEKDRDILKEQLARSEKALEISDRQHIEERNWRIALQDRIRKLGDVEKKI